MSVLKTEIYCETNEHGEVIHGQNILRKALRAHKRRIIITIQDYIKKRSLLSNGYYWKGVIEHQQIAIYELWGERWSKERVHDFNKLYFFGEEKLNENTGEVIRVPGTSVVGQEKFSEAIEMLKQYFSLNFNYEIPEPGEQMEL